ncbi:hypothetical protein SISSUDRAFT_1038752, partial [Sistotremastrum suecicum HHB10207 ss-3]
GDVHVKNAVVRSPWREGRRESENVLKEAGLTPPFAEMEKMGGFSIYCPFGGNKMVIISDIKQEDEVDEDEDENDVGAPNLVPPPVPDPIAKHAPAITAENVSDLEEALSAQPDIEDKAEEMLNSAKKKNPWIIMDPSDPSKRIHKSSVLKILTSAWSQGPESTDRLKRVAGKLRHAAESATKSFGESTQSPLSIADPAAAIFKCKGTYFLAVVQIKGFRLDNMDLDEPNSEILKDPSLRANVQIMHLTPIKDAREVQQGDWE